jgi:hypothetical protein
MCLSEVSCHSAFQAVPLLLPLLLLLLVRKRSFAQQSFERLKTREKRPASSVDIFDPILI